jgi:hypothetical protein
MPFTHTQNDAYTQLRAHGFVGCYSCVAEALRAWQAEARTVMACATYIPLQFE